MRWSKAKRTSGATDPNHDVPEHEEKQSDTSMPVREYHHQDEKEYPDLKVVLPIVGAVCLSVFLASLDRTIIGVAIPAISNDFNSFGDISWYESAFLLTFAALQLPSGQLFTYFPAKWTFIFIVLIFEVGSAICAAAPTSTAFIIGRAIAGIGCAGSSTGGQVIFANILPLEKRPKYQGFIGATFGVASIAGPLLGGVFTTKVSWRWCFYINLPFGGLAIIMLLLFLPNDPAPKAMSQEGFWRKVEQFDPVGLLLLIPGLILVLLALQWGGNQYSWSSARVIATLVVGIMLLIIFGISQVLIGENATLPPRIMCQRTIASASAASLGFGSALIIVSFYLPIWYQAVQQLSAIAAGVRMLAYFFGTVIFVIGSGFIVSKTGYYTPWLIGGTALMIVGCGLFSTLEVGTSTAHIIGYQIVFGAGMGMALTQTNVAAQTVLAPSDIPIGVTLIQFANFIGGTIFVTICQSILSSTLKTELRGRIPGLDVSAISGSGATSVAKTIPSEQLPVFLQAYNKGIVNIFYCALSVSAFAFISSWLVEWKSVKKQPRSEIA